MIFFLWFYKPILLVFFFRNCSLLVQSEYHPILYNIFLQAWRVLSGVLLRKCCFDRCSFEKVFITWANGFVHSEREPIFRPHSRWANPSERCKHEIFTWAHEGEHKNSRNSRYSKSYCVGLYFLIYPTYVLNQTLKNVVQNVSMEPRQFDDIKC